MQPPIEVRWGDESKRFILAIYQSPWSWKDFEAGYAVCCNLIRSVDYPVDVLSDVRGHPEPPGPDALRYIKWVWDTRPANLSRFLILGADGSTFMKHLVRVFASAVGGRDTIRFVDSMDEALALVAEQSQQTNHEP